LRYGKKSVEKIMPILLFFGPDGSGKSTLASKLAYLLAKRGYRVHVSWMRGTHTITLVLAHFLSSIRAFHGSDNPYFNIRIPKLKHFWQLLEFISALPIILIKYVLPSKLGWWIIGERSLIDFIVWIACTTTDESYTEGFVSRFLITLASKSQGRFYITARLRELVRRRKSEATAENIKRQLILYDELFPKLGAYKLDTSSSRIEESLEELIGTLNIAQA